MITLLTTPHCAARLDHRLDVALDGAQVAGLQRADVDDHVDLGRAVEDRPPRLELLDVGRGRARAESRRPSRRRRRCRAAAPRRAPPTPGSRTRWRSRTRPPRGRASRSRARVASGLSSVWSISAGNAAGGAARGVHADPRRAGIENAAQPVGAAIEDRRRDSCSGEAARRGRRCAAITSSVMMSMSRCRSCGLSMTFNRRARNAPRAAAPWQPADVARLAHRACPARCRRCGSPRRILPASEAPERQHVGAVVLARVARDRFVGAHRGADAADLVGGDRRSDAGAVDDDAGVRLAARHRPRDRGGDVRIVHRIGWCRCRGRRPPGRGRAGGARAPLERHAGVVAADRDPADVGHRRQVGRQRRVHGAGRHDRRPAAPRACPARAASRGRRVRARPSRRARSAARPPR